MEKMGCCNEADWRFPECPEQMPNLSSLTVLSILLFIILQISQPETAVLNDKMTDFWRGKNLGNFV